jgi:protease-4
MLGPGYVGHVGAEVAEKKKNLILWLLGFAVLIFIATGVGLAMLLGGAPGETGRDAQWLHVRITPAIADAPGNEGLILDPSQMPPLSTEIAHAIATAATDDRIEGLLLEIEGVGLGWAQTQEIRDAVWRFRDEGKPSIAWAEFYGNKEYYLASAAQELHLPPAGLTLVNGLSMTTLYYAGTFEKFGVSANFEHVGDFKSAVEPYERTGPSPAASEATNALLDSIYSQFLSGIAEGRGIDRQAAEQLVDNPPVTALDALARGLIDALSYRDQIDDQIDAKLRKVSAYIREDQPSSWMERRAKIAVVHADGTIVSGRGGSGLVGGRRVGSTSLNKILKEVREDDDIVAVVLRVNSPGGSGMASDAIWREVGKTLDTKPLVVSMGDLAASGGYYISMGADQIVAQPGTITGSIGVFGGKLNLRGLYEQVGLSLHRYERGDRADMLSSTEDFDPEDRAKFRTLIEGFYQTFVEKAAQGRGMTFESLHKVAQGRVWTGEQALALGLVDQLGGLDVAIDSAKQLAGVSGRVEIIRYPERLGFLDQLIKELDEPTTSLPGAARLPSAAPIEAIMQSLLVLDEVLADNGVAAILPGHMIIR